jgi:hypothetical protein
MCGRLKSQRGLRLAARSNRPTGAASSTRPAVITTHRRAWEGGGSGRDTRPMKAGPATLWSKGRKRERGGDWRWGRNSLNHFRI